MRGRNTTMSEVFPIVKSGMVGKRKPGNVKEFRREQLHRPKFSSSQSQSASLREEAVGQENCSHPTPSCDEDDGLSAVDGSAPSQSQPFQLEGLRRLQSSRLDEPPSKKPPRPQSSFRTIGDAINETRQVPASERKPLNVLNGINQMLSKSPLKVKPKEAFKLAPIAHSVLEEHRRRDGEEVQCSDGLPPMDWSLKTSARFSSTTSFNWCLDADAQDECSSLRSSAANERSCPDSQASTSGRGSADGAAFRAALHSWSYPESSLPPIILQAVQNWLQKPAGQDARFWTQREASWQESLRSLYLMLRTRMCPVFYCRYPQYVAMFMGPGIGGHGERECCAYITRSTRGMRDLFKEQGIQFVMPLYKAKKEAFNEDTDRQFAELAEEEPWKVQHEDPASAVDSTPQSLLFFEGADAVHGLYDTLLNHREFFPSNTLTDAPPLISPVPFANAALKTPRAMTRKMKQANGSVGYSLELTDALVAPWIISRVCEALKQSSLKALDASFVTDPLSHCLNVLPSNSSRSSQLASSRLVSTDQGAKVRGCLDEQEEVRWQRAYKLGVGVVRQLRQRLGAETGNH
ncbi:hypothetical protein KFL_000200220 [Klebsormidium nitens]|uniref:Uncharacterized protein n=1 Tax=Klebsormidium nitens TaxID=105231 RepID=A0A1Y1HJZ6_KLENI|nr:hypothetical protein KFL_000200220 [Klebsormidium nitens]|eukprot:GAQ78870.1 hypothetical protein KFL_000200220 [Klebsormidium nitens]